MKTGQKENKMANLVFNHLTIVDNEGGKAHLLGKKFYDEGMAYWRPMPKAYLESFLDEKSVVADAFPIWYLWAKDNWGTKWDIYEDKRKITYLNSTSVKVSFITANSSIEPFIDFIAEMYPWIDFYLSEQEEFAEEATEHEWKGGII